MCRVKVFSFLYFYLFCSLTMNARIGGIYIRPEDNKVLMLRGYNYDELWTPWGGQETYDIDDKATLSRELQEELWVELSSLWKLIWEGKDSSPYGRNRNYYKYYLIHISGEPMTQAEIRDIVRFSKEDFFEKKYAMIEWNTRILQQLIDEWIW